MVAPARRFLKWLDTDIPYLLRGGGWTGASQIVGAGLGLITAYCFAAFLPHAAYGMYKYVLAVAALLAIPALNGMNTAVLQAIAQGADGTTIPAIRRRFLFGLLGGFAGVGIGGYYLIQGDITLGVSFLVVGLLLPFIESLTTAQFIPVAKKRFGFASLQTIATSVFTSFCVIGALILTKDPLWIVLAYFGSTFVARVVVYLRNRKLLTGNVLSKESLAFGMHTSAAGVLAVIANNADIFVLWHLLGAESLAVYAFALAAVTPFQALVKSLINLAHPKFASHDLPALVQATRRRAQQSFLLLIPLVLGIIFLLPLLFSLLFPSYQESVLYAQVMMLSVLLYPEKLYGIALTVTRESKAMYAISLVSAGARIAFFLLLIPLFGIWGAVGAMLFQQAAALAVTRFYFRRMEAAARAVL